MPETIINIPVQQVASMISSMTENEIETLLILLSEQGEEIRERDADLKQGRVSYLDRDEAFDVYSDDRKTWRLLYPVKKEGMKSNG